MRDKSYLNPSYQDLFTSSNLPVNIIISPEKEVAKSVFRRFEQFEVENVPFGNNNSKIFRLKDRRRLSNKEHRNWCIN